MMGKKYKVFCKDCINFRKTNTPLLGIEHNQIDFNCVHPSCFIDSWFEPKGTRYEGARTKNINNNCRFFTNRPTI